MEVRLRDADELRARRVANLRHEGLVEPLVRKLPHCPPQRRVQVRELVRRLLPVVLGRYRTWRPIVGRRERASIARQGAQHEFVVTATMAHELPDAVRTGDGMAGSVRGGKTTLQLEYRRFVPRLAVERSTELLSQPHHLADHHAHSPLLGPNARDDLRHIPTMMSADTGERQARERVVRLSASSGCGSGRRRADNAPCSGQLLVADQRDPGARGRRAARAAIRSRAHFSGTNIDTRSW